MSAYLGLTLWNQPGTHDYKGELPHAMWLAGPELCGYHNGDPEKTPQQLYDPVFVNGKDDALGHPSQPSHYIIAAHGMAPVYCPNDSTQDWGPIDGAGWYNFIQSHSTNSACPSRYTGGCNTTP